MTVNNLNYAPTEADEPAIDREAFLALKESMGAKFPQLVGFFIEDIQCYSTEMMAAHADNRFADLSRVAHTIKSSSLLFGCSDLSGLAASVEAASNRRQVSATMVHHFLLSMKAHASRLNSLRTELS